MLLKLVTMSSAGSSLAFLLEDENMMELVSSQELTEKFRERKEEDCAAAPPSLELLHPPPPPAPATMLSPMSGITPISDICGRSCLEKLHCELSCLWPCARAASVPACE
jgi:hypothetical protein